jgi:hypothetical protein
LVRAVFGFMTRRVFHKDDFAVFEGGIVRLKGQILREIAGLTLAAAPIRECVKVVRWLDILSAGFVGRLLGIGGNTIDSPT